MQQTGEANCNLTFSHKWVSALIGSVLVAMFSLITLTVHASGWMSEEQEKEMASMIVGPTKNDDNCSSCHALETEAWEATGHFATFKTRHRTDEAKQILANMGSKSMKRAGDCRQCHYTSELKNEKIRASFGVSCESCHGPAREWLAVHSKVSGEMNASDLKWGTGKAQTAESRTQRLAHSQEKGMINSSMIYAIAKNCFGCHTVPNETIVNQGGHKAGSDFELVSWSQGEVRHNFSSSAGAPDSPTNRPASTEQKRRLYVTGLMVDLETTLANISRISEKNGSYHLAMVKRANAVRDKLDAVLAAQMISELSVALQLVPSPVVEASSIASEIPEQLSQATQAFLNSYDGSELSGIDGLIPTESKGTPY